MKHFTLILFTFFFIVTNSIYSQRIGFEYIQDSMVTDWIPKFEIEYIGIYKFGDSEMESELVLFAGLGKITAQLKSGQFNTEGTQFLWNYKNIDSVEIIGNEIKCDLFKGRFVRYNNGNEIIKGLEVLNPWSGIPDEGEYEIGVRITPASKYFAGKYPEASFRHLSEPELEKYSKDELQIMRNETFARYGYIFELGGKMDLYFRNQDWYIPQYVNVNDFLHYIEKHNISLIKRMETK